MAPSASSPAPSSFHPAALPPFKRHVRTPSKSMQRFARKRRASSLSVARPVPQPPAALQPAPAAVDAAQAEASSSSSSSSAAEEHNFSCRICLSVPEGPVVTPCGHLACWKCLYSWLAMHPHAPSCPVCKAHCAMHDVLPIYGAGLEEKDPRAVPVPKPKPSQPSGSRRTRPSFVCRFPPDSLWNVRLPDAASLFHLPAFFHPPELPPMFCRFLRQRSPAAAPAARRAPRPLSPQHAQLRASAAHRR